MTPDELLVVTDPETKRLVGERCRESWLAESAGSQPAALCQHVSDAGHLAQCAYAAQQLLRIPIALRELQTVSEFGLQLRVIKRCGGVSTRDIAPLAHAAAVAECHLDGGVCVLETRRPERRLRCFVDGNPLHHPLRLSPLDRLIGETG